MQNDQRILRKEERAVFALRNLYQHFGYKQYKMSRFEEYDLYVRNKDFLVSDEVITFTDRNGRLMALKPDVTLSIIKNAADRSGVVEKLYYNENVYRTDPGTHSFREIMQAGLECIGDLGTYEIGEVVLLAVKSLALIGERYVLDVSHMGLISAILEESGLSVAGKEQALMCLRQKNAHELDNICQKECVAPAHQKKLQVLISCSGCADGVQASLVPLLTADREQEMFHELYQLCKILENNGFAQAVQVDFSVGNDMKYYSGVVFKGYLEGIPASVLSGGQYDKLLQSMGRDSSAIGFAIYLDLLEQLDRGSDSFDIDTLLLHDGSLDAARLIAAAEEAARDGSVLVATALPEGRTWRKLVRFEHGEAI